MCVVLFSAAFRPLRPPLPLRACSGGLMAAEAQSLGREAAAMLAGQAATLGEAACTMHRAGLLRPHTCARSPSQGRGGSGC